MTIKEMTMDQVNERIAEIRTAIDAPDADLDALNAEIDELEARKSEIEKSAEQRKALRAKVITTGATVRTFGEDQKEESFNASSPEYRSAWLKNMAVRDNKYLLGTPTEIEQRAFTFTTANTGAVVPTETLNRIVDLVQSMSPMYDDATKSGMTKGFGVPRHTGITAGDAAATDEGVANADEQDAFDLLAITGVEIKKHVVISRKMEWQSIDAFEAWLTQHIAKRIAVAKETQILTRLDAVATGIAAANKLTHSHKSLR